MPVSIWTYPGEGDRAELLKAHIEALEKRGTVDNIIPLQDAILIHYTVASRVRETRTTKRPA